MMKTCKNGHPVAGYMTPGGAFKNRQTCPRCSRVAAVALAATHAERHALPSLIGSPVKVEWAMTIRHRAISDVQSKAASLRVRASSTSRTNVAGVVPGQTEIIPTGPVRDAALLAEMLAGLPLLCAETSADWWVANRSTNVWHWLAAVTGDRSKMPREGTRSHASP